jgi:hypothetical protein
MIGVMALHSSTKLMPSAQPVAAASQKERLAKPAKQTPTVAQKEAQPPIRKVVHVTSEAERRNTDVLSRL